MFGNLRPCHQIVDAVIESLKSYKNNGYFPSIGCLEGRKAVVSYYSKRGPPLRPQDVVLTSGCSHALEMCMSVLCGPGSNILIPRPGFPMCQTLAPMIDVEIRFDKHLVIVIKCLYHQTLQPGGRQQLAN